MYRSYEVVKGFLSDTSVKGQLEMSKVLFKKPVAFKMDRFKNARIEKGLSQESLRELLGVTRSTIWRWDTGRGFPDEKYHDKLIELGILSEEDRCNPEKELLRKINFLEQEASFYKGKYREENDKVRALYLEISNYKVGRGDFVRGANRVNDLPDRPDGDGGEDL